MKCKIKIALIIASTMTIAACSDGPSAGDIKAYLQVGVDKDNEAARKVYGADAETRYWTSINELILHGCDEIREDVFRCDVEIDRTSPFSGNTRDRVNYVFRKTDSGWVKTY